MNVFGIVLIVLGGVVSGLFTTPMQYAKMWPWECLWMMYSLWGMCLLPWILCAVTVQDLGQLYADTPVATLALVALFGAGWGCGSVLFGVGTAMVGNSLGFTIILGFTSTLGSAIPLVVQHPEDCFTTEGLFTWGALAVTCLGLVFSGIAGNMREQEQAAAKQRQSLLGAGERERLLPGGGRAPAPKSNFLCGILICLVSGFLSPMLNLALAFGVSIKDAAEKNGTGKQFSNNPVWCVGVGAGFLMNVAYAAFKMQTNGTWSVMLRGAVWHDPEEPLQRTRGRQGNGLAPWLATFVMGLFWYGGNNLYGIGSNMIGDLGPVVGWPMFIVTMILTGNVSGIMAGEWNGTSTKSKIYMAISIVFLAAAVIVGGVGSTFSNAAAASSSSSGSFGA